MSLIHTRSGKNIVSYNFQPGDVLADKYKIVGLIGKGWEGEVYMMRENSTGVECTAKVFFPQRNEKGKASNFCARKLHKLRHCDILIRYHTHETIEFDGNPVIFLVSEYVDGELLSEFQKKQPGKKLAPFEALHLLKGVACGVEQIHAMGEYHGDIHSDNILIQRHGLDFKLKLIDPFHWGKPSADNILDDVCSMIALFYELTGGQRHYAKQPPEVKQICCGLKRSLIAKKFRTAGKLRQFLENLEWE